ncbi:MAG: hypothetical protein OXB97_10840, partial [Rhodospirillales bacterium]|nr:hypothetical protein [Rhodospirillales bacterium]
MSRMVSLVPSAGLPGAALLAAGAAGIAAAQGSDEAVKAAARNLGAAGQVAARGVATDAEQALAVPGFAGTDVAQTGHTDANMSAAARDALADPNSEGGAVGAFVASSRARRPDTDIESGDAAIVRGDAVQDSPTAAPWRAGGLASGSVRECGRGLAAAQAAGRCGGVTWCVGAECERVDT